MREVGPDEPTQSVPEFWLSNTNFQSLQRLSFAIGVSKIIFATHTDLNDTNQGQYLFEVGEANLSLADWEMSSRQKAAIRTMVRQGKAIIILSDTCDDAVEILGHELGHHIISFLCGMRLDWCWATPTNPGMSDLRLDDYTREINEEFVAGSFTFYLGGQRMKRIDLRRLLRRVVAKNKTACRLLTNYRKQALVATRS